MEDGIEQHSSLLLELERQLLEKQQDKKQNNQE
jgi:hypothetical protein